MTTATHENKMNTTQTCDRPGRVGTSPEFLETLRHLYRLLGLTADEAQAASHADAELFAQECATGDLR